MFRHFSWKIFNCCDFQVWFKINLRFFTKLSIKIWSNVRSLNKTDSLRTESFVLLFVWASKSSHIVDLKLISKKSKQLFDLDWTKTWIYCWENKYFNLIYHSHRNERFGRHNAINPPVSFYYFTDELEKFIWT